VKNDTSVKMTSEEGVEITVQVPTDAIEVLRNLQPGEDYHTKLTGFSEAMLQAAFSRVQNAEHWKNPIVAYCAEKDQNLVGRAIEFFTSSEARFSFSHIAAADQLEKNIATGDRVLFVEAPGYFAAVGA
jgi:hypothetical protein